MSGHGIDLRCKRIESLTALPTTTQRQVAIVWGEWVAARQPVCTARRSMANTCRALVHYTAPDNWRWFQNMRTRSTRSRPSSGRPSQKSMGRKEACGWGWLWLWGSWILETAQPRSTAGKAGGSRQERGL